MTVVVADASALLEYLLGQSPGIAQIVTAPDTDLHTPALCDVEVVSALRRALRERRLALPRAQQVLRDHLDLPVTRHGHERLLDRMLELRDNFSAYDAAYASLAEALAAPLLTADAALARSIRANLGVEILAP